ncbi:MAG: hypothetical protein AB7S48_00580 [Bacteroidales bacterium]
MKQIIFTLILVLGLGTMSINAQLFPRVTKPSSPEMSMLVIQFAHDDNGKMGNVNNMNFSGWAPAVMGPDGKVIPFRNFDAGADFTNIYYSENLPVGEYKLIGFYHVYIDYSKLDEVRKGAPDKLTKYAPYEDLPYHVKQLVNLSEPVVVTLEPNKVMTFGTYAVKYKWFGGLAGTTDDRWRVVEDETSITVAEPQNNTVLRYIKSWATPAWKKWNAKNDATVLN